MPLENRGGWHKNKYYIRTRDNPTQVIMTGGDWVGNLQSSHPMEIAQRKKDSAKFREMTDLKARGII
jgi:hypothetical protein